jgi:hypothetical protein
MAEPRLAAPTSRGSKRTEYLVEIRFADDGRGGDEFGPSGPVRRKRSNMAAIRKVVTLLGPEPWNAYIEPGDDADSFRCCSGWECGCGGQTYRTEAMAYRAQKYPHGLPAIESVKVFKRTVTRTAWEPQEFQK